MTSSAPPMLTGDTSQPVADATVRFGVGGRDYEIDLSARHASELRSMVGRYLSVARRIQPAPARARSRHQPRPAAPMGREQSQRIRSWAAERGLLASPRGRIPQHVVDAYQATMLAAPVPSRPPGTAGPEPASRGRATGKPSGRRGASRATHDQPAATPGMAAAEVNARGGARGLTERERHELRAIADTARPQQDNVAGRLRSKGLADRDSAGNWWPTDAGRRELMSA